MSTEWGSTIENATSAATFQCLDRILLIPRDLRQRRNRALGQGSHCCSYMTTNEASLI